MPEVTFERAAADRLLPSSGYHLGPARGALILGTKSHLRVCELGATCSFCQFRSTPGRGLFISVGRQRDCIIDTLAANSLVRCIQLPCQVRKRSSETHCNSVDSRPLRLRIFRQPRRLAWNAPQDAAGAETVRSYFARSQPSEQHRLKTPGRSAQRSMCCPARPTTMFIATVGCDRLLSAFAFS